MLSLFTRRVALSAHRTTATYARILPSPVSTLRARTIADTSLHASTVRTSPQRNASTGAAATTKKTGPSTKSSTTGRAKLTPEEKEARARLLRLRNKLDREKKAAAAVALRAKRKVQAEKKKEAAAQKRKRLAERKKKLADAKKEKERKAKASKKAIEAKKLNRAYIWSHAHVRCRTQDHLSCAPVIKPPPRRMSGFSLYLQETKKTVPVGMVDWKNLSEEERQVSDASAFVLGKAGSY